MMNKTRSSYIEWDANKERLNIQKHGISFSLASKVFSVFTYRNDNIRIISARLASARERSIYYER